MAKKWTGKWIEKSENRIWFVIVMMIVWCGLTGCANGSADRGAEDWKKTSSTTVASQTYQDATGNKIIYYCCKTTYHEESIAKDAGTLDRQALAAVVDWEQMEESKGCMVGQWPAMLCKKDGQSYLCWTISPEYSCVIEYDAAVVAEEDIFRMAESVVRQQ